MVWSFKAEQLSARIKDVFLTDVDGDHDLDAILSTDYALHVYEHASDHSLSLPNQTQTTSFPVSKIRLSGHTTRRRRSYIPSRRHRSYATTRRRRRGSYATTSRPVSYATTGRRRYYAQSYHPYLADWDLDGDLDLAILSESPLFVEDDHTVHPRFFEHQANHSVSELRAGPNSSCPLNWSHPFSVTDFDDDGQLDVVGMRGTDFIDLEVLVCLQSSAGYVVMNQAGSVPAIPTFFNQWVGSTIKPTESCNMCEISRPNQYSPGKRKNNTVIYKFNLYRKLSWQNSEY